MNIWTSYKGNLDWLQQRTIFLTKHGSHAYGTNIATSDIDIKGVAVPPKEILLGFIQKFEQADMGFEGLDCAIYSLQKFLGFAAANNPNLIELPFTDISCWIHSSPAWELVFNNKNLFLSQAAKHRFSGYAIAQLKRLNSHRSYLLRPPTHKPTRQEYGLPDHTTIPQEQRDALEAMMLKTIESWQVDFACLDDAKRIDLLNKMSNCLADMKLSADDQYVAAGNKLGLNAQAMEYLKSERSYRSAMNSWHQYQTWLKERNPVRAEMERKFGMDCKHAMHLVRLLKMCKEILNGQGVIVKRPDAEELLSIRNGAWSYDHLMDWTNKQMLEIENLSRTTTLPKQANRQAINKICIEIIEKML